MSTKKKFIATLNNYDIRKEVLQAFINLDREFFFDNLFEEKFYTEDRLPIGCGEKSDEPYTLARMLNYLSPQKSWRILEIGTGSGYSTALLSLMAKEVYTIEYHEELAVAAKNKLNNIGLKNIRFFSGEGTDPEVNEKLGKFDAIIVFAACQKRPLSLLENMAKGSSLVFPMGPVHQQQITILKKEKSKDPDSLYKTEFHEFCTFSPIIGKYGIIL